MDGQSGQLPTKVLGDQLTLHQPEEADCALTLLPAHPALGSFLRPWAVLMILSSLMMYSACWWAFHTVQFDIIFKSHWRFKLQCSVQFGPSMTFENDVLCVLMSISHCSIWHHFQKSLMVQTAHCTVGFFLNMKQVFGFLLKGRCCDLIYYGMGIFLKILDC